MLPLDPSSGPLDPSSEKAAQPSAQAAAQRLLSIGRGERIAAVRASSTASTVGASSSCGAGRDKIPRRAGEAIARAHRTTISSIGDFQPPPLRSYTQRPERHKWFSFLSPCALRLRSGGTPRRGSFNDELLRFAKNGALGVGPHTAIFMTLFTSFAPTARTIPKTRASRSVLNFGAKRSRAGWPVPFRKRPGFELIALHRITISSMIHPRTMGTMVNEKWHTS
jgi:hypothetical protein